MYVPATVAVKKDLGNSSSLSDCDLIVIQLGTPVKYIPKVQFEVIILVKNLQMVASWRITT